MRADLLNYSNKLNVTASACMTSGLGRGRMEKGFMKCSRHGRTENPRMKYHIHCSRIIQECNQQRHCLMQWTRGSFVFYYKLKINAEKS